MPASKRFWAFIGLIWGLGLFALPVHGGQLLSELKLGKGDTVLRGDAKCTICHDDSDNPKPTMLGERPWVLAIGKTKHGTVADGRTPTCASCHGESEDHLKRKDPSIPRPAPDRIFGKTTPAAEQDKACTSCHKGGNHMFWEGSAHKTRGVACATCHNVHSGHDKVRDKKTQTEVCLGCHKEQRAQLNRPSHHPVLEGKMACSDCHNPHGSSGPKQLKKDSINETCYMCHTEKRGPFIHNHQPVTEDCSICHNAHGTTAANLLKQRMPLLCNNCHNNATSTHRNQLMQQLPGRVASNQSALLGSMARGCTNCHTNIHGGNSTQNSGTVGRFRR